MLFIFYNLMKFIIYVLFTILLRDIKFKVVAFKIYVMLNIQFYYLLKLLRYLSSHVDNDLLFLSVESKSGIFISVGLFLFFLLKKYLLYYFFGLNPLLSIITYSESIRY